MPTDSRSCHIEILSRTEHCTVGYCRRCNLFHVDLGAISLRLHTVQLHAVGGIEVLPDAVAEVTISRSDVDLTG